MSEEKTIEEILQEYMPYTKNEFLGNERQELISQILSEITRIRLAELPKEKYLIDEMRLLCCKHNEDSYCGLSNNLADKCRKDCPQFEIDLDESAKIKAEVDGFNQAIAEARKVKKERRRNDTQ